MHQPLHIYRAIEIVIPRQIQMQYSVTFIFKTGVQLEEDCTVKKPNGIHGIKGDIVYSYLLMYLKYYGWYNRYDKYYYNIKEDY